VIGVLILLIDLTAAKPDVIDAYKWSPRGNGAYYGFTRSTFALGCFLVLTPLFLGTDTTLIKELLRRPFFRVTGKLCLLMALIAPMAITMRIMTAPDGNQLYVGGIVYMVLGNIFYVSTLAFVLYLLV
jgi:hypothetical protein